MDDKRQSIIIVAFVFSAIIISMFLGLSLFIPFLLGLIFSGLVLSKKGFSRGNIFQMVGSGIRDCTRLYFLILLIGANVSVWMASGTVPAMIYYGFDFLDGANFLLIAFFITALMSIFMGSAVGTIGTLGIAILGIGRGFGIPYGIIMGTLVSGAYVADKISPISGLVNLNLQVTGVKYRDMMIYMQKTFLPVFLLGALFYFLVGSGFEISDNGEAILKLQAALQEGFHISPWLFILPLLTVILPFMGVNIIITILTVLSGGIFLAYFFQGTPFLQIIKHIFYGFSPATNSGELNEILVGGGVLGMVEVVFIVGAVIALSGLLDQSGTLKPLLQPSIQKVEKKGELFLKSGLLGSLLTAFDQTVGIVLTARVYGKKYRELNVHPAYLARTISDSSTVLAPIIPWNVNVVIISSITGISVLQYGPYAALCYLFPLVVGWIYLQDLFFSNGTSGKKSP